MKTILLGVSGSVAAYKSAELTSELTKLGYQVDIIMTRNSTRFIPTLTLQSISKRPVHVEVMTEEDPSIINHIELVKRADLFLIAPASANTIGKLANGIGDDLLSTVALAMLPDTPKLIAPAMNTYMYQNLLVQRNLATLKEVGYEEIPPIEALLACGDYGRGALATLSDITKKVTSVLEETAHHEKH